VLFAFLGTTEIFIILGIALLVFGPTKLPEIGRQIAMAMREMRKMSSEVQRALDLDDYRYDRRYEPPTYPAEDSSTWTPDSDGETMADAGDAPRDEADAERRSDRLTGTRPWSVQDDVSPEDDTGYPVQADSENGTLAAASGTSTLPAPVTTVEPPGPPKKQEE
jgi:TatA/E family protein of Tat protein translocase